MVNLKILAHPLNWITLALWLFAIGFAAMQLGIVPKANNGA